MTGGRLPDEGSRRSRHFILNGFSSTERFRSVQGGGSHRVVPPRNRARHGRSLMRQLASLEPGFEAVRQSRDESGLDIGIGLQVEFSGFPDIELAFESLARERMGIELLNVRYEGATTFATILVPDGKLAHFERLIQAYLDENTDRNGRPIDNRRLVDAIREIRAASLRALWTDEEELFPPSDTQALWWEVWLQVGDDRGATIAAFRRLASAQEIRVPQGELVFPERTVLLAYGSAAQLKRSVVMLSLIAELRRAKETAEFFDSLSPDEQPVWLDELLQRTTFGGRENPPPYVCILDSGVNNGHPLLTPALADVDLHTVEPSWGVDDGIGHGSQMAGLALIGDLTRILDSGAAIHIRHRLESVKIINEDGGNGNDPRHHGYLTSEAIARPEITAPGRARVFALAVTARDNRDRGRPSAWSATIDSLAADADGEGATPRLVVVSAGNINDPNAWDNYPASNTTDGIHDPSQAWNALTVGAYTNLVHITESHAEDYRPVAIAGGMSPFTTTSATWQAQWPLKPDVVFEGGNAANDGLGSIWMASLSLLTTNHLPAERLFTTMNATSAATALGAGMAAQIMDAYPGLRPETVRALIVHSASWTAAMRTMFLPTPAPQKGDYLQLVRHCGFGVPSLDRALWSAANSLVMIIEQDLQPFAREAGKEPTLRDMQLHKLPWPLEELEALGELPVEMRVTLSYFIEPNPSERGRSRYRYESHGLRFEVKRSAESESEFRSRINRAARDEEEGTRTTGDDPNWLIGKHNRHKGSLHSDIWRGTATDLASRGVLAVYPALGWWKTRAALERYEKSTSYSLIVSIHAPEVNVDLYTAIANQIATSITVET